MGQPTVHILIDNIFELLNTLEPDTDLWGCQAVSSDKAMSSNKEMEKTTSNNIILLHNIIILYCEL